MNPGDASRGPPWWRAAGGAPLRLLAAAALLEVPLVAIGWLHAGGGVRLAAEAPLLVGLLALCRPRRWNAVLAGAAGILLAVLLPLAALDAVVGLTLGRPLEAYTDWRLLRSGLELGAGDVGTAALVALALAGAAATAALAAGCTRVLRAVRGLGRGPATGALAGLLLAAGILGAGLAVAPVRAVPAALPAWDLAAGQVRAAIGAHRAGQRFAARLEAASAAGTRPLPGLAGVDVIVAFVESYGAGAVDAPRHARTMVPVLAALGRRLGAAGLHAASGRVESPVRGGRSWLAHGTLLSGLRLERQWQYERMVRRAPATLIDDLEATGHRSVAVMPAMAGPWEAGRRLGWDRVLDATAIDYAGPRFGRISTMPDQFAWTVIEDARARPDGRPAFVLAALTSSHAPWRPVPPVLDWARLDDGGVYAGHGPGAGAAAGWLDPARMRRDYPRALAYALEVAGGWAARHVDRRTLLVLLGDHQPAPVVTGGGAGRAVPMHVISADPALVAPFLERGLVPGMRVPADDAPPRMAELRAWLHAAFGKDRRTQAGAR